MSARYVTVSGNQFNKSQFAKKWSGIVDSYETGVTLSAGDTTFLADVAIKIPRFARIMARGRVAFKVVNKEFNGKRVRGIVLITPNSGFEVWMGKQAVINALFPKGTLPNLSKENRKGVLRALRSIIEPQIREYRRRFAGKSVIKSSLTGQPIFGKYHVDHVYPFIRLVEEWCRENGYDLETIPVKCKGTVCRLANVAMAESWFDYHSLNAKFQVLNASENISKGSRYFGGGEQGLEDTGGLSG